MTDVLTAARTLRPDRVKAKGRQSVLSLIDWIRDYAMLRDVSNDTIESDSAC